MCVNWYCSPFENVCCCCCGRFPLFIFLRCLFVLFCLLWHFNWRSFSLSLSSSLSVCMMQQMHMHITMLHSLKIFFISSDHFLSFFLTFSLLFVLSLFIFFLSILFCTLSLSFLSEYLSLLHYTYTLSHNKRDRKK